SNTEAGLMGRGLSSVQQAIMTHAKAYGFITPYEAVDIAGNVANINVVDCDNWNNCATAIASRSLRRLVARGLLTFERRRYKDRSNIYRVTGWHGALPNVMSKHWHNACEGVAPLDGRISHNPLVDDDVTKTFDRM